MGNVSLLSNNNKDLESGSPKNQSKDFISCFLSFIGLCASDYAPLADLTLDLS